MTEIEDIEAELFRALSHPLRLRILRLLAAGEQSVGDLSALLQTESSAASQHLTALRHAGLVESRKAGTSAVYSLRDESTTELLAIARRLIRTRLADGQILLDQLAEEAAARSGQV